MGAAGRTILVIDDDPDVHDAARLILEGEGHAVSGAVTAAAGLDAARRSAPAAILLDIMLDTPTAGFEVARALRRDPAHATTPLIFISSIGATAWREQAEEAGLPLGPADWFVEKPFDAATLRQTVRQALAAGPQPS